MNRRTSRSATRLATILFGLLSVPALALALSACGGGGGSASPAAVSPSADASCSGVSGTHHARVVVEVSRTKIVSSCVGFSSTTISAVDLIKKSGIEFGTQTSSYGLGICQADNVPAHFSTCFPSDAPYWALFTSRDGAKWVEADVGVSHITVHPGDSIGLRYDSASASPPPPAPSPA